VRIRENLSPIVSLSGKNVVPIINQNQIGKVYAVVMDENVPSKKQFERVGKFSGLGAVLYLDYEQAKNIITINSDDFWDACKIAYPLKPNELYHPLIGELIVIEDLPSAASQVVNTSSQKYYSSIINLWNNIQHNAQPSDDNEVLGQTFLESGNISNIQPFEGDYILQGRKGNSLRFGTSISNKNTWSSYGNGEPITILSNGHKYISGSNIPYVEDINKEASSIWLTTNQKILLNSVKKSPLNVLTNPTDVSKYFNSQIFLNADRVVLNSKKDDILILAKTNIEFGTDNIINLNAGNRVHINSPKTFLGTKPNGTLPDEPMMLGNKTITLLSNTLSHLYEFCSLLSAAVSTPEGSPIIDINTAAEGLMNNLENDISDLKNIVSTQNFLT